jgi:hypothetical protein
MLAWDTTALGARSPRRVGAGGEEGETRNGGDRSCELLPGHGYLSGGESGGTEKFSASYGKRLFLGW